MLSTNKLRSIYLKLQTQLFYMIPEKWDKIYLYASVMEQVNNLETGEMFFYYYPAGLLKRNPVNVYEIPNKFNIEEEEYLKLVEKLYASINQLRQAFKESKEEEIWTNLTIIIEDNQFTIKYSYDDLLGSKYTSEDRHLIWKCKYLGYPVEKLSRKERKMLDEYNIESSLENTKTYTEAMYKKQGHNIVEYINDDDLKEDEQNEDGNNTGYKIISNRNIRNLKKKERKKEEYKKQNEEMKKEYEKELQEQKNRENEAKQRMKNQILNV